MDKDSCTADRLPCGLSVKGAGKSRTESKCWKFIVVYEVKATSLKSMISMPHNSVGGEQRIAQRTCTFQTNNVLACPNIAHIIARAKVTAVLWRA